MAKKMSHRRSRKTAHRKSKRAQRKMTYRRRQRGGEYNPKQLSLLQGQEYEQIHRAQHGGAAPVGDLGRLLLDGGLRETARVDMLDRSYAEIANMRDQMGGARRRRRRTAKGSRKSRRRASTKKSRSRSRMYRKQSGGNPIYEGSSLSNPTMLLTPSQARLAGTGDFKDPLLQGR